MPQRPQFGRSLVLAFVLTAALVGCDMFSTADTKPREVQIVANDSFDVSEMPRDSFLVDSASVDGDVLRLQVSYNGGCGKHRFVLYSSPSWIARSNPPAVIVYLSHEARGDTCQKSVQENLAFGLSPIQDFPTDSNEMRLGLRPSEYMATSPKLVYTQ